MSHSSGLRALRSPSIEVATSGGALRSRTGAHSRQASGCRSDESRARPDYALHVTLTLSVVEMSFRWRRNARGYLAPMGRLAVASRTASPMPVCACA